MEKSISTYTAELKAYILRQHFIEHIPVQALCEQFAIASALFYEWQRQFFDNGAAAFTSARLHSQFTTKQENEPLRQGDDECSGESGASAEDLAPDRGVLIAVQILARELGLTHREAEVLYWLSEGKGNAEIATLVGVRPRTIGKHLEHVFVKLGVESRTAAAGTALRALLKVLT